MKEDYKNRRRQKKKLRWSRVLLLLIVLALLLAALYWIAVGVHYAFFTKADPAKVTWPVGKEHKTVLAENRMNVLVLGLDGSEENAGEPHRTDSMLLVSFDLVKKGVSALSIPRDTRVHIPGRTDSDKINHAYFYGGVELARQTVANFLNVPVNNHVVLDARGFMRLVDVLGGVGLYVENDMKYDDPYQNLHIDIKKGYQKLNGEQSINYIKFRSDELGDIGRVLRQQKFGKAFAGELLTVGGLARLPFLNTALAESIKTDIELPQAVSAVRAFKEYTKDGIVFEMLPGSFFTIGNISYWVSEQADISAVLKKLEIVEVK